MLGPILFLIYVNVFFQNINKEHFCRWYPRWKNTWLNQLVTKNILCLNVARTWFNTNNLTLNSDNTQSMLITSRSHNYGNPESIKQVTAFISKTLNSYAFIKFSKMKFWLILLLLFLYVFLSFFTSYRKLQLFIVWQMDTIPGGGANIAL